MMPAMSEHDAAAEEGGSGSGSSRSSRQALRRVISAAGGSEPLEMLADELSGADLTTLLLEVFRRRAERISPADVMRRYRTDRFVAPVQVNAPALRRAEDVMLGALPPGFEVLTLAPVLPLGAHTAAAGVDPRNILATGRGSEAAPDPTNGLALEAAVRSAALHRTASRAAPPVRLAASQRAARAQPFTRPGSFRH